MATTTRRRGSANLFMEMEDILRLGASLKKAPMDSKGSASAGAPVLFRFA
jgi:hypothetical protein